MPRAKNVANGKILNSPIYGEEKHYKMVMLGLFLVVAGVAFRIGLGLAEVLILMGILLMAKGALISADTK